MPIHHAILDDDGHLKDHNIWSHAHAQALADSLGVVLDKRHFEILYAVRTFYDSFGHPPATRALVKFIQNQVDENLDNATLQKLFATGLIARHINRIAGLPKPANCL